MIGVCHNVIIGPCPPVSDLSVPRVRLSCPRRMDVQHGWEFLLFGELISVSLDAPFFNMNGLFQLEISRFLLQQLPCCAAWRILDNRFLDACLLNRGFIVNCASSTFISLALPPIDFLSSVVVSHSFHACLGFRQPVAVESILQVDSALFISRFPCPEPILLSCHGRH